MISAFIQNSFRVILLAGAGLVWSSHLLAEPGDYFQILYDTSTPTLAELKPGFGYAVYIQADGKRILFDTGADPDTLEHNLSVAGVDLNKLDMVVVSHNHFDHAGGLARVRELNPSVPVYLPPNQIFAVNDGKVVESHLQITPNIFVIHGRSAVSTAGISNDLSIVLRSSSGPYVLSTCSHSGVEQIIDKASQVTGEKVFYFSGGARLVSRPESDTRLVAKSLDRRQVQMVSPSHCSLSHLVDKQLRETLGERVVASRLGEKVEVVLAE